MIITAGQLKESRAAMDAGVDVITNEEADNAIRVAEAVMNKVLGYKVANDAESVTAISTESTRLVLPERVRSVTEVTDSYRGSDPETLDENFEIRGGFSLYRAVGWRADHTIVISGEFGFEPTIDDPDSISVGDDEYVLGQEFVTLYAVRHLQRSGAGSGDMPAVGGAVLTGYQSEGAAFQFFTPTGDSTGYQDLDNLLDQIGKHPGKSDGLYAVTLQRETMDPETLLDFPFDKGRL